VTMGVKYVSWAYQGGYGIAAQGYLRALLRAGVDVSWLPLFPVAGGWAPAATHGEAVARVGRYTDPRDPESGDFGSAVLGTIGRAIGEDVAILHTIPELWPEHRARRGYNIGNTVWETDALPAHWPDLLNGVDHILVPSRFNAEVFREGGVLRTIDVVPHVVGPPTPPPTKHQVEAFRNRHAIPADDFVFYCIDAWDARKAPWKTVGAYLSAFDSRDPVTFILKTTPRGPRSGADPSEAPTREQVDRLLQGQARAARVVLISRALNASEIDLLHHVGSCYVSLTHGEGWGLGAFEAASKGNAVVTTGWGGSLDYLGEDWPYLVSFEMGPVMNARGLPSYHPSQRWALPDHEHARALLRSVREDPATAARHGAALSTRIRERFAAKAVGARLVDVLSSVGASPA
jgi:glycosyltransferase involved in cell wall biosynthesis